jgi:hypothetical protein
MQVVLQTLHPEALVLKPVVETRLRFATQRMAQQLQRVTVRLKDLNGPKGGPADKECQIQLTTTQGGLLVVSSRGSEWRSVLELAIARASHHLTRLVQNRRQHRKSIRKTERTTTPS